MIKRHDKPLLNTKQANPAGQSSSILHEEHIGNSNSSVDPQILD